MTDPGKAVFLSYASQDREAAQRLCDALRAAGVEVWFDQSELRGGDAWDQKIRREIRECALFVPLISANTAARPEGYFRLEWSLADARSHMIARNKAFIVPVCLDRTAESGADVPESFQRAQWTRLPGGAAPPAFIARIAALLGSRPAAASPATAPVERSTEVRAPAAKAALYLASIGLVTLTMLGSTYLLVDHFQFFKRPPAVRAVATGAPGAATPALPEKSVAVLPFLDMSEKKDQEYFSDGLSEELIDLLTKVADLRVPARTSSFYFKGRQSTIADIARTLGVTHVLEGSVRESGNRVRVTAQLVRADNGYHLWSETFDRKLDDIFKIQDEIAGAVVKALKVTLLEAVPAREAPTTSSEAYSLFIQAGALMRRGNRADAALAIDCLQRAIKLDPKFAPAWARLTQARTFQYELGELPYEKAIVEARHAAQRAIELDPSLAAAHLSMGRVHAFEWNWGAAQTEVERAQQLDPGDADALRWGAILPLTLGHASEAKSLIERAAERDPLNGANYAILGDTDRALQNYAAAELAYHKAIELAPPRGFGAGGALAIVLLATGRPMQALATVQQLPDEDTRLWGKALVYFALGRKAESTSALSDLKTRFAETDAADVAYVHAYRGEIDEAFKWLDRACLDHDSGLQDVKSNWLLTSLRGDPRYKNLLRRMNLPE